MINFDELKELIKANLPYEAFWEKMGAVIARSGHSDTDLRCHCPYHEDKTPSFSVCIKGKNRGAFICHSPKCGKKGDIFDAIAWAYDLDIKTQFKEILKIGADLAGISMDNESYTPPPQKPVVKSSFPVEEIELPPIDEEREVNVPHRDLLTKPEFKKHLDFLMTKRGLSLDVIKYFRMGYTSKMDGRFLIPIIGPDGTVWNIRKYKPHLKPEDRHSKFLHHKSFKNTKPVNGKNKGRSYHKPHHCFTYWDWLISPDNNFVVIAAGELDTAILIQNGIPAFCELVGEGNWSGENDHYFKDKKVIIAFDNDEAGEKGAIRVMNRLKNVAPEIRVIKWPSDMPDKGDVTDYFVTFKKTKRDFEDLMEAASSFILKDEFGNVPEEPKTLFDVVINTKNYNKRYRVQATVSACSTNSLTVPRWGCVKCHPDVKCRAKNKCPVQKAKNYTIKVDYRDNPELFLYHIMYSSDRDRESFLKALRIPKVCFQSVEFSDEVYSAIETRVTESINRKDPAVSVTSNTSSSLFYIGKGGEDQELIKENSQYTFIGKTQANPKNHNTLIVANHAIPELNSLDNFKVGDSELAHLRKFRPLKGVSVQEHIEGIAKELSINVCQMVGTLTTAYAILTTVFTPKNFTFCGIYEERGWGQTLLIGDQGTGKSESFKRYNEFCPTYEMIEGANISISGLIGGMESGEQFNVFRQGVLPRNDLGMIAWDEFKKTPKDIIGLLTGVRSSGRVKYTKLMQRELPARTRLLMYTSPPSTHKLKQYNPPIKAALGIFHSNREDVRRLDNIFLLHEDEVDATAINSIEREEMPHRFTDEDFKILTSYAWTRHANNIYFSPEAERFILSEVLRLGKKYTADIPLIDAKSYRVKLAKMSVCIAILSASFNDYQTELLVNNQERHFDAGECVIVLPEHVEAYVKGILEPHLDDPRVGLLEYSIREMKETKVVQDHLDLNSLFFSIFEKLELKYNRFVNIFADRSIKLEQTLRTRISPTEPKNAGILLAYLGEKKLISESPSRPGEIKYNPENWVIFLQKVEKFYAANVKKILDMEAKFKDRRNAVDLDEVEKDLAQAKDQENETINTISDEEEVPF